MSVDDQSPEIRPHIRFDVTPDPTEEELVAILQALELLRAASEKSDPAAKTTTSYWEERARQELLRRRNWPPQARSWGFKHS